MPETIGFVGLGIMGSGMVRNLAAKGHTVRIWNRTESKAEDLAKSLKIEHAKTLKDLGASSSVLMLCVTNTSDVEQVLLGKDSAAPTAHEDSSSIPGRSWHVQGRAGRHNGRRMHPRSTSIQDLLPASSQP